MNLNLLGEGKICGGAGVCGYGWVEGEVSGSFREISTIFGEMSKNVLKIFRNFREFPENGPDLLKFTEIHIVKLLKF